MYSCDSCININSLLRTYQYKLSFKQLQNANRWNSVNLLTFASDICTCDISRFWMKPKMPTMMLKAFGFSVLLSFSHFLYVWFSQIPHSLFCPGLHMCSFCSYSSPSYLPPISTLGVKVDFSSISSLSPHYRFAPVIYVSLASCSPS